MGNVIKVNSALLAGEVNGYSDENQAKKDAFHREAKKLLKNIAEELSIPKESYRLSSNEAGIAGSGDITLHADSIYIQISDSVMMAGNQILYRSCTSQKDYSGGANNFISLKDFKEESVQSGVLQKMKSLMVKKPALRM